MRFTSLLLLLISATTLQAAQERLALVIGNAAYKSEEPLENTLNDARDVAAKLRAFGFEVTQEENVGRRQLARSTNAFLRKVQSGDAVALFYYSGHGLQVNGQNYLVPVDAQINDELDVHTEGLALNQVLRGMGGRGAKAVNLVILDACRNNPFKKQGNKAIGDRGLARVEAPESTLILYATRPGATASDNPGGKNGLFTKHLLQAMDQPGVKVEEVFRSVATNVYQESGGAQYPWPEGLTFRPFYFVPAPAGAPGAVPMPPGSVAVPPPPPAPPPVAKGYLQVVVDVEDARVMVNGKGVGTASAGRPLNLSGGLPVGLVQVLVSAPGGTPQVRTETIQANRWTQAVFNLREAAVPTPAPEPARPDPAAIEQRLGLDRGERRKIQESLNALGHDVGVADGIWGNKTREGIAAWQRTAGRPVTGYLTPEGYKGLLEQAEPVLAAQREREQREQAQARAEAERRAREQAAREPRAGKGWRDPVTGMEFVWVPKGCYRMGSNSGASDEKPVHEVCLDGYWLGKTEVTQGQWKALMGNNPSDYKSGDDHPVEQVSWNDAQEYIRKLNGRGSANYRLPTEAEWEYACRSGGKDETYSGSNSIDGVAWYNSNSGNTTHAVGTKAANGLGLQDMSGNVWEWVEDSYSGSAYSNHTRNNPVNTGGGSSRVLRGGSWEFDAGSARCAYRYVNGGPGYRYYLGFRLLRK